MDLELPVEVSRAESADAIQRRIALRMTYAERFDWLVTTVEELLPWLGAARAERPEPGSDQQDQTNR